jgi:hypothetical protein
MIQWMYGLIVEFHGLLFCNKVKGKYKILLQISIYYNFVFKD